MKQKTTQPPPAVRMVAAGLLAWFLPGAGHLYVGERARGITLLVVIALTFWAGVAAGGVKNTVNPQDRSLWFLGQICAGVHPLIAVVWSRHLTIPEGADPAGWISYGQTEEVGVVYTAIAGMLNVLVIFDVLGRVDRPALSQTRAGPARTPRRASA